MGSFIAYASRRKGLIVSGIAVATAAGVAAAVIPAVADSGSRGGGGQEIAVRHGGHTGAGGGLFGGAGTGRGGTVLAANLHTAQFPGGAVRGQFHKVTTDFDFRYALRNFQASVVRGKRIYECEKAEGGGYAFVQRDVSAVLGGRIAHSFVKPGCGTPQWIAPDRSAVTGSLISKSPNGDGNIPELDLRATQSGKHRGLLANTAEILRLNTVGGVAPAGSCAPGTIVGVPYQADHVFINAGNALHN
ncbi:DUF3455 domain-containing protein [Streptomyces phaeolivaceus]|uniref:DUF3455 domain-containing protein n=1 Tax=Streptomyces phaeolivaceus TaxID=2653200 RepID=A0A5P8K9C9_9ACTN|nr:DUF3455 domain-containing protein [Streptomyces phaeolivaceus]QFQ99711.1 DUF3455 domain-containing protein [Streptomyces phaeolivaceus]